MDAALKKAVKRKCFTVLEKIGEAPGISGLLGNRAISKAIRAGNFEDAEAACRRAIQQNNDNDAYRYMGRIAIRTGRPELAVEMCRKVNGLKGKQRWRNDLVLGHALRSLGRHEEAFEAFKDAVEQSNGVLEALKEMLEEAVVIYPFPEAVEIYHKLIFSYTKHDLSNIWYHVCFQKGPVGTAIPPRLADCQLKSPRDWALENNCLLVPVEKIWDVPVKAPKIAGAPAGDFTATYPSNQPYYAELRNVRIFSHSDIILTSDGYGLTEIGTHELYGKFLSHQADAAVIAQRDDRVLLNTKLFEMKKYYAAIMLSGTASSSFGHWMPEYLARLQFLEHHPEFCDLPIIVDSDMPRSHFDFLTAITDNELIYMGTGAGIHCARLIYAPPPTFFPMHLLPNDMPEYATNIIAPESYRYIKAKVEDTFGKPRQKGGKYFLSRRNMSWSLLENDAEVSAFLESQGYEIILIETLSFEEQVRLFQGATDIIAPNGSAVQHIIFSEPSTKLLLLAGEDVTSWSAFAGQVGALGYSPEFLCGSRVGGKYNKHANYSIDVVKLAHHLKTREAL